MLENTIDDMSTLMIRLLLGAARHTFRITLPLKGDLLVIGGFPSQGPVMQSFDVFLKPEQTVEKNSRVTGDLRPCYANDSNNQE